MIKNIEGGCILTKPSFERDSLFALYFYGAEKWPVNSLAVAARHSLCRPALCARILPVKRVKRIFYAPLRRFSERGFCDFRPAYTARSPPQPMERPRAARREGFSILLVTASAACYMRPFVERGFADALLGTETERDGRGYTGAGWPNRRGRKVRRIRARFWSRTGCRSTMNRASAIPTRTATYPCSGSSGNRYRVLRGGEIVPLSAPRAGGRIAPPRAAYCLSGNYTTFRPRVLQFLSNAGIMIY